MSPKTLLSMLVPACALALSACGSTTTSAGFSGAEHEAAQTVANLQSAANAGEGDKICADYLAAARVSALGGRSGCETALKHQLAQVDNLEATIESVRLAPGGRTASVSVKSIYFGKNKLTNVSLVKEGSSWKVSGP